MRFMAGFMNVFKPNDEGRVSEFLGIGLYTLSLLVCILLFFWIYSTSKEHRLSKKFNGFTFLLIILYSSALILLDQFLVPRLL